MQGLAATEQNFTAEDGIQLFQRRYPAEGQARGTVALIHGATEHSGRYAHVADFLNARGYAMTAFDLRGHGQSGGRPFCVRSFDEHTSDAERFIHHTREWMPPGPLFLLGSSMGGLVATLTLLKRSAKVDGLVLSSPLVKLGDDFTPLRIAAAKVLGKLLPHLPVGQMTGKHLSRDPAVIEGYRSDPLVFHSRISAEMGAATIRAINELQRRDAELDLPLLVMHGTADLVTDPAGSKRLYERARSQDKTLKLYNGWWHELMQEPEREQVLGDLAEWLDARSQGSFGSG